MYSVCETHTHTSLLFIRGCVSFRFKHVKMRLCINSVLIPLMQRLFLKKSLLLRELEVKTVFGLLEDLN